MNYKQSSNKSPPVPGNECTTIDALVTQLSHNDRQIRKTAAAAMGETGDARMIGPLLAALSRELSLGPGSYGVITEIIIALSKIPNCQVLDALIKLESQLIDRGSPQCPPDLPLNVITYLDVADCRTHRIVPRELHFKVLDAMRRMSARLNDRSDYVADRYNEYQQAVAAAEVDRVMPEMSRLLLESEGREACRPDEAGPANSKDNYDLPPEQESLPVDAMAGVDYGIIRREIELEMAGYARENDQLKSLIQDVRRIKYHRWLHPRTR